ncbi:MAG TPA: CopL family metal-binding regulatory protein [Lysobacter sp.]
MLRIVLRLLLCLSLVLNGAGYAVAATQMQIAHQAMAAQAAAPVSPKPCHEAGNAASGHETPMAHETAPPAPQGHGTDCCQTSLCTCDCLQHATAAMTLVATPTAAPPARCMASPSDTRSPAPPSHTPLRPPIG